MLLLRKPTLIWQHHSFRKTVTGSDLSFGMKPFVGTHWNRMHVKMVMMNMATKWHDSAGPMLSQGFEMTITPPLSFPIDTLTLARLFLQARSARS